MTNENLPSLPIGVFDSGVGGLTVLKALQRRLPQERFFYLGDTARLPYGSKSQTTVIRYAHQATEILVSKGIKCLIVACNTASALALHHLQKTFPNIAIIGVLDPGAKWACEKSASGQIAIIATEATIQAQGYQNAIRLLRPDAHVTAIACNLLVALAEESWLDNETALAAVRCYLQPLLQSSQLDTLVLGCTHFPILLPTIRKVLGDKISIVDSAEATAQTTLDYLSEQQLLQSAIKPAKSDQQTTAAELPATEFFVTDNPQRFARIANLFLGAEVPVESIQWVDLMGGLNAYSEAVLNQNYTWAMNFNATK